MLTIIVPSANSAADQIRNMLSSEAVPFRSFNSTLFLDDHDKFNSLRKKTRALDASSVILRLDSSAYDVIDIPK
jgi:hypothetical protein